MFKLFNILIIEIMNYLFIHKIELFVLYNL